jgi:hypothetical protein
MNGMGSPFSVASGASVSYAKAYGQEMESPMRPYSMTVGGGHKKSNSVTNIESNPLFVDPKRVLSQLDEEKRNGQDRELEISELKVKFDATLAEKEKRIEELFAEVQAKSSKLSQATSAARMAASEKAAAEKALVDAKERNEKLAMTTEREFSSRKKDLLAKAAKFKKLQSPVLLPKDRRAATLEAINETKSRLYTELNMMTALPFHNENFQAANAATQSSVLLSVTYPPDVLQKEAGGVEVKRGNRLTAALVERAPTFAIDASATEGEITALLAFFHSFV